MGLSLQSMDGLRKAEATWGGNDGMGTCILLLLLFATPLKTKISLEDFDVYLQDGRTVPSLALKSQSPSLSQQPPSCKLERERVLREEWLISPTGRGYSVLTPRHKHRCVLGDNDI